MPGGGTSAARRRARPREGGRLAPSREARDTRDADRTVVVTLDTSSASLFEREGEKERKREREREYAH